MYLIAAYNRQHCRFGPKIDLVAWHESISTYPHPTTIQFASHSSQARLRLHCFDYYFGFIALVDSFVSLIIGHKDSFLSLFELDLQPLDSDMGIVDLTISCSMV